MIILCDTSVNRYKKRAEYPKHERLASLSFSGQQRQFETQRTDALCDFTEASNMSLSSLCYTKTYVYTFIVGLLRRTDGKNLPHYTSKYAHYTEANGQKQQIGLCIKRRFENKAQLNDGLW